MYPDGISYLDLGDAIWRGDWHNAVNGYWSPVYPAVLGFFLKLFKPSPACEYPLVHLVNFLVYVFAIACFDFFLRTFITAQPERRLPDWTYLVFGYCAFIVSSLSLITISFVSPDMLIAAVIFLACAVILKIHAGKSGWRMFALLGAILGVGYLTKTVMFLASAPFIAVAAASKNDWQEKIRSAAISFAFFAAVAAPLVTALSIAKGRPTFGDSGKINYEMNVGTTQFFIPSEAAPKHPVRRLSAIPEAYEYSSPIAGTYPLWFDPSYWHDGIQPSFDWRREMRTALLAAAECLWILFNVKMGLCISTAICVLYLLSNNIHAGIAAVSHWWVVWFPALASIALYSLVVIEPRYVGAQFCVLWIVGLSGVAVESARVATKPLAGVVLVLAVLTCASALYQSWQAENGMLSQQDVATPECETVAAALRNEGLKPGDKVAVISGWLFPSRQGAYIARLDRLRVVAEARPDSFWSAKEDEKAGLMTQFADVGAAAVLTYKPPQADEAWRRVEGTDYYLTILAKSR
jgi:hypothetical protein